MSFKINGPIRSGETKPVWQATADFFQVADLTQQLAFASVYLMSKGQLLVPGTALVWCTISKVVINLGDQQYTWSPKNQDRPTAILLLQFPPDGWEKDAWDAQLNPPTCTCLSGEIPVGIPDTRWQDHFQLAMDFSADPPELKVHSSGISFMARPKMPWDNRAALTASVRLNVMLPFDSGGTLPPQPPLYVEMDRSALSPAAVNALLASFSNLSARLISDAQWAQLALPSQNLVRPGIPIFSWTVTPIWGGQSPAATFHFGPGEVTLTLNDRSTDDPAASFNVAIATPDVTFSTPDATGKIQLTVQSGAAPGPNTGIGIYTWSEGSETLHFEKLEASYDPIEVARSLRDQLSLDEPAADKPEPLLLWGCVPLDDGWAQLPFFNLSGSIYANVFPKLGTPQLSQLGPLAGVVSWGNEDNPYVGEQPWSTTLLGVDGLSGTFDLVPGEPKIKSFTLKFVNPALELNGFLWLASDPPTAADALPSFDNWLRAIRMVPLRSCYPADPTPAPYSAKFASVDFNRAPGTLKPVITGWTFELSANANSDAMTQLTQPTAPFKGVPDLLKSTTPLIWRQHPALPTVQTLPLTQSLDPPAYPSPSRRLVPFVPRAASWTFTATAANAATRWPILTGDEDPVSGVAAACLSLPGLWFDASPGPIPPTVFASAGGDPARIWLSAQYRHGLPYLDEPYALSQVSKTNSANPVPVPPALTRDDYGEFWAQLNAKSVLAQAQGDDAITMGPPTAVQGLVEPRVWPVAPVLSEIAYPGKLTLSDTHGGEPLVLEGDAALAGLQGRFNAVDAQTLTRVADGSPAVWQVIGGSLMAQGSGGVIRDQRGLTRSASSAFTLLPKTGAPGIRTPLTTPDGKTWLLTSARQSLPLQVDGDTSWQFWFRDLPVASDMSFVRDHSRSKASRGINDPAAFSPKWVHLNGYEWRMGYGDKCTGLPLLGFCFYPLTLETVTFAEDGSLSGLEVVGRLLFSWNSEAPESHHANAVKLSFRLDAGSGKLTLGSITADAGDPDRDDHAAPVPAGNKGGWALTSDDDPNPARLYWNDVTLQDGAIVPTGAVLDFFFWGERWQVAIPLAAEAGRLRGEGAITGTAGAVLATKAVLSIDPSKETGTVIEMALSYRWGDIDKVFLQADQTNIIIGEDSTAPGPAVSLAGPTGVILPLSGAITSQNGSVQVEFTADTQNTVPSSWQLLPGMNLSATDPIRGFATMTFSVNGLTGPNGPPNQTPLVIHAGFAEVIFQSSWGQSLQESGDTQNVNELYAASAGDIVAGYSCSYNSEAAAWAGTLLLNGLLEVRNLISWPLQPKLDTDYVFHVPSVRDAGGTPLDHVRHTSRMLFDQHEVPTKLLVAGGARQIFTLAGDVPWSTLVITEHQLVTVTDDPRQQAAALPVLVSNDRRWTVLQPVRFFTPVAFSRWLGNFTPSRKTAFAISDRVNSTEFKDASALYGGRMLELLPDEIPKLRDSLIIEASGAGWIRKQPSTATFSPLDFLPGATPGGAFTNPDDLNVPFGTVESQWCLASVPFLGRLLPTPQTPRSLLSDDPIVYLSQVREGGGNIEPLPLRLAGRTDLAAFDIMISSFDLPARHTFQRLDPASLEEGLFRLSTPPAEQPDQALSSVLATLPSNGPGRLARFAALSRVYDSQRNSLPPSLPSAARSVQEPVEQVFQIQGFGTFPHGQRPDYTTYVAGALLLSSDFIQTSGNAPSYYPAAWLIAPDMTNNPEPVTVAVSPFLGLKRFRVTSTGDAVMVSGELLGTQENGQLDVLARQTWMPPKTGDPAAFESWATSTLRRIAPDSRAAVLRFRKVFAGSADDGTRTATVGYSFKCLNVEFQPPLAVTTHPIRTHAARLRFAEGHYGGCQMPDPLQDFEVAPPQVRDVQPIRLEKRPAGQDWPWGVSVLRSRVRYAGSSDQAIGIAGAVDNPVVWWQGASQIVQFAVGEEAAYELPSLFRAPAIRSLTPACPNPDLPKLSCAPELPETPVADPPPPDDNWQSLLPGAVDYMLDGYRPGAGFVLRNDLQRQNGNAVSISGGLPVQHRMVRPVPLRKNKEGLRDFALRSWSGYFEPAALQFSGFSPSGTAFVAPRIDDKNVSHHPQQLRATLTSATAGAIPADWDGSVTIQFDLMPQNDAGSPGWQVAVQIETASGALPLTIESKTSVWINGDSVTSQWAPSLDPPSQQPGSALAAVIGALQHGDPVVIAVTAEYVREENGLVTISGYQQRIEFHLRLSKPQQPPLPLVPVYTVFEDPEYNRALVSQTAYAEGLWLSQNVQHRIRLAFDRREYNATSSFAALYADEDNPAALQMDLPAKALLKIQLIRADGTTADLAQMPAAPNVLIQGSLHDLFTGLGISPVAGDSIAGTLNIVQGQPPTLVQSIATVLVAIVDTPVTPAPQAAYALLRKNNDAVCCARFAWSPAASKIELLNPDDLRGETVRRRASFCWLDTVRLNEDCYYAVQKIACNGSTHSIEDELWIQPNGSAS